MATTTFATVNGVIVGENVNGQLRDYMPDTLGSTAALLDNTQTKTATWTYWPYGEVRTGGTATRFLYVGTLGYRSDDSSRAYVRARELQKAQARWMQVDPRWPSESAYAYAGARPSVAVDPSGTWWINIRNCNSTDKQTIIDIFNNILYSAIEGLAKCVEESGCVETAPDCLRKHRDNMPPNRSFTIECDYDCQNKNQCGEADPGNKKICLCLPPSQKCKPTACVIAHELLHLCGILGIKNFAEAFLCVGTSIPGCAGFQGGHGLDG